MSHFQKKKQLGEAGRGRYRNKRRLHLTETAQEDNSFICRAANAWVTGNRMQTGITEKGKKAKVD